MVFSRIAIATSILAATLGGFSPAARGDIFVLASGGEIRGELLNPDENPRRHYIIRPYAGGKVALAAAFVMDVIPQQPVEIAYDHVKLEFPDTVDGQWQLAEWCRTNNLDAQREEHLQRIIELDPDHAEARRLLGYDRVGNRWMTRDEVMTAKGYVKYGGRWRLRQVVELEEKENAERAIQKEYYEKVRRWKAWLESDEKSARAEEYLLAIDNSHAVDALMKGLEDVKTFKHKEVFAKALANIGTPEAIQKLVEYSIEFDELSDPEQNEDLRYVCFDLIERIKPPAAVKMYIDALGSKDNRHVNRAAIGLARMGDKSAVAPLIAALITEHKFQIGTPGQTTTSFGGPVGSGGTSFGTGGGARIIKRYARNEDVLLALKELTGKDYYFDKDAWYTWLKTQQPEVPKVNTRRD